MDYDRIRELQQKFEENPRRYFAPLANEYRKGGQHKRAIEICRTHLAQMPGHMSGQIVFGQALFESGEWDEARTVFGRALALDPENLIALRSLGDMSLQAGDTAEARKWYTRLLDADPKDTAVIALVTEIDSGGGSPRAADIPKPEIQPDESHAPETSTADSSATRETSTSEAGATEFSAPESHDAETPEAGADTPLTFIENAPAEVEEPVGLERHYPVESAEQAAPPDEDFGGTGEAIEGITSAIPDVGNALTAKQQDEADALDSWAPPPGAPVHEHAVSEREPEPEPQAAADPARPIEREAPAAAEQHAPAPQPATAGERSFTGASAEPFVNETMAQLYLQQGYRQLALKVYRQLSASRPHDQALKDRIADIEAADAAEHPEEVARMRKDEPSIERPSEPASPRSPSIESPAPSRQPGSEESPGVDRSPIDSPPSRDRESIEAPAREEPRVEPEGIAARQPSVREFFATLGRRRPPRSAGSPGGRTGRSTSHDAPSIAAAPPGASLDAVFAGATVSPSDARAASRLAGAFSGATGASRTPPTPPMPTPRVNPRIPQAQESEEDVAKFRAWLDGLTRE